MSQSQKLTVGSAGRILKRCREMVLEYERRGLLTAERTESGIRLFDPADVRALKVVLDARGRSTKRLAGPSPGIAR